MKTLIYSILFIFFISENINAKNNIILLNTFSGKYTHFGTQVNEGLNFFKKNTTNKIFFDKFNLVNININCKNDNVQKIKNKIKKLKPHIIINAICPKYSKELSNFYETNKIVNFWIGVADPLLTINQYNYLFRISPNETNQAHIISKYINDHHKDKKIAIFYENNKVVELITKRSKKLLMENNLNLKIYQSINLNQINDIKFKNNLIDHQINLVILNFNQKYIIDILKKINSLNEKIIVIGNDSLANPIYKKTLLKYDNLEIYYTFSDYNFRKKEVNNNFSGYENQDVFQPFKEYTYILFQILEDALSEYSDNNKLIENLNQNNFDTIYGNLKFINNEISINGFKLFKF